MLAFLFLLCGLACQDPAAKPALRGLVKGPDGKALGVPATVTLALHHTDGSYRQQKVRSGADGRFTLELEPGWQVLELWARARGYAQGHAASGLEVALPAGVRLGGTLVDKLTQQPLAGAQVWAESPAFDDQADTPFTRTDAEGRFELAGLSELQIPGPGGQTRPSFDLHAEYRGHAPLQPGSWSTTPAGAGRYTTKLELLPTNCELNGVVNIAVDGAAAPIALVTLIDELGGYQVATTKLDGSFAFGHVAAGRALLWAWPTAQAAKPGTDPLFARDGVQLKAGPNATVLWLEPIAGTELAGRAQPEAGAEDLHPSVLLRRGIGRGKMRVYYEERVFELDGEGRFSARDLLPGHYQVELRFAAGEPRPLFEPARAEADVEVGVKTPPLELRFARPIRLSGKVEGLSPAQGPATVEYARAGAETWSSVRVLADGGFGIGGLWPAKWRLRVRTKAGIGPEIEAGPKSAGELHPVPKS